MQWRDIKGYEGLYQVSDEGQVKSLARTAGHVYGTRTVRERILKAAPNSDGYPSVTLYKSGHSKKHKIHVLVKTTFSGPRPEGLLVLHKNGNPSDNRLTNLYWGTAGENNLDKVKHGTDHNTLKTVCPRGHKYTGANLRVDPKTGERACISCRRARSRVKNQGLSKDMMSEISDEYYSKLQPALR